MNRIGTALWHQQLIKYIQYRAIGASTPIETNQTSKQHLLVSYHRLLAWSVSFLQTSSLCFRSRKLATAVNDGFPNLLSLGSRMEGVDPA